jgi:hypothetical protein
VELDPGFAPAWARLGRCHRVLGKYVDGAADSEGRAGEALQRALALNPRLTIAHKFSANLEADIGESPRAVVRLLGEATRHGNDPELFAGLVHACRYCGLFEASLAAHAEASLGAESVLPAGGLSVTHAALPQASRVKCFSTSYKRTCALAADRWLVAYHIQWRGSPAAWVRYCAAAVVSPRRQYRSGPLATQPTQTKPPRTTRGEA